MTPSKIREWLKRIPAGAQHVQLSVDTISGLCDVATWERSDVENIEADEESDVASSIIEQAQEWVDGEREPCKFQIRWMSEKCKPLRVATHRATPTAVEEVEEETSSALTAAENVPAAMLALIRDLGRRDTEKDKQMVKVLVTSTTAYDKTIAMLTGQLQSAYSQLAEKHGVSTDAAVPVDLSPEQREEVIQRAKALEAFTGKVPDMIDLILAALAAKYLPDVDGAGGGSSSESDTTEH